MYVCLWVCHACAPQISIANLYLLSVKSDDDKCVLARAFVSGGTFSGSVARAEYCGSVFSH